MFYLGAFVPPPLHESADPTAGTAYPPPLPDWYLLWAFGCLKVATDLKIGLPLSMIPFLGLDDIELFLMSAKVSDHTFLYRKSDMKNALRIGFKKSKLSVLRPYF